MDLEIVLELYPELSPRFAIFQAWKDSLISATQRDYYLSLHPDMPATDETPQVQRQYTLKECRDHFDILAGKTWGEMSSEDIDAVIDSYDRETKNKALAYLKMRGYDPE